MMLAGGEKASFSVWGFQIFKRWWKMVCDLFCK